MSSTFESNSSDPAPIPTPSVDCTRPEAVISTPGPSSPLLAREVAALMSITETVWHNDGGGLFLISNRSGKPNIWSWRLNDTDMTPLASSEDTQRGLAPLPDGNLLFLEDANGNEFYDIHLLDVATRTRTALTDRPDIAYDKLRVSPDGRYAVCALRPRGQWQSDLAILDIGSGAIRHLPAGSSEGGIWSPAGWSADGRRVIANRAHLVLGGPSQIWEFDVSSGLGRQLKASRELGRDEAVGFANGWSTLLVTSDIGRDRPRAGIYDIENDRFGWFASNPWPQRALAVSPDRTKALYQIWENGRTRLRIVDLRNFEENELSLAAGTSEPCTWPGFVSEGQPFSPDSNRLILSHSAGDAPQTIQLVDPAVSTKTAAIRAAPASWRSPPSSIVTFESFDETRVSGILTMPFNLARDGSNAAIVMVHGGPTMATSDDFDRKAALLASNGYIVLRPNYRGSTGFGAAFEKAQIGHMGQGDLADLIAARKFLIETGYVDPARVGITGTSAGGWLTLLAVGQHPTLFGAAAQVVGIFDWITFLERADPLLRAYVIALFGTDDTASALFRNASPITFIDRIRTPVLSLAGAHDMRVPAEQAQQATDALTARGIPAKSVTYDTEGHFFTNSATVTDELEQTLRWFDQFLGASPSCLIPAFGGAD